MASTETTIRHLLRSYRDVVAVERAVQQGSPKPIARRVGRRVYGKATGRLARRLFG